MKRLLENLGVEAPSRSFLVHLSLPVKFCICLSLISWEFVFGQFLCLPGLCHDRFLKFLLATGVEGLMETEGMLKATLYLGKQALLILGLLIQESLTLIRIDSLVMGGHRVDGGLLTRKYLRSAVHTDLRSSIRGERLIRDQSGIIHWRGLDEMHPC